MVCAYDKKAISYNHKELAQMGNSEMWQAGKAVRALCPREKARIITGTTKGVGGRKSN